MAVEVLTPDLFTLVAESALACVCNALNAQPGCGCPCRVQVTAGAPAWDDCCNGQLSAWLERVYFFDNFPAQKQDAAVCNDFLAGDFVIQLLRCAPVEKDDGSAPTAQELTDSARQINIEMYVAIQSLACCLHQTRRHMKYIMRAATPIGPDGGCVGWELRFSIELLDPLPEAPWQIGN